MIFWLNLVYEDSLKAYLSEKNSDMARNYCGFMAEIMKLEKIGCFLAPIGDIQLHNRVFYLFHSFLLWGGGGCTIFCHSSYGVRRILSLELGVHRNLSRRNHGF